jgi:glucuronoxylan 4-O-methyltransferase
MAMLLLAIVAYGIIERRGLPSMCSPRMSHVLGGHGDMPMTALIHYATTGVTPQQSKEEIMVTARVLSKRGPCNLLVFGLGHDSMMWAALNVGGKTMFLEEDATWIKETRKLHPSLRSVAVTYETRVSEAGELLRLARCFGHNFGEPI